MNDSSLYRSTPEKMFDTSDMSVDMTFLQRSIRSCQTSQLTPDDNKENIEDWSNLSYNDMISSTLNKSSRRMSTSTTRQKPVTPSRKKKFTGKNLSHSFSLFCGSNEMSTIDEDVDLQTDKAQPVKSVRFYTCDSGFNDGQFNSEPIELDHDVSMQSEF